MKENEGKGREKDMTVKCFRKRKESQYIGIRNTTKQTDGKRKNAI